MATKEQIEALMRLFDHCDGHSHSGALVIQRLLLGLYNGYRFPFDLTDLRRLDRTNFEDCLQVLRMDFQPQMEVHVQLACALGHPQVWASLVFERWAFNQRLKGRCKKEGLEGLQKALRAHSGAAA